jgi:hypothetical protein
MSHAQETSGDPWCFLHTAEVCTLTSHQHWPPLVLPAVLLYVIFFMLSSSYARKSRSAVVFLEVLSAFSMHALDPWQEKHVLIFLKVAFYAAEEMSGR